MCQIGYLPELHTDARSEKYLNKQLISSFLDRNNNSLPSKYGAFVFSPHGLCKFVQSMWTVQIIRGN